MSPLKEIYTDLRTNDGWNPVAAGAFAYVLWPVWGVLTSVVVSAIVITMHGTGWAINAASKDPQPMRARGPELRVIWSDTRRDIVG